MGLAPAAEGDGCGRRRVKGRPPVPNDARHVCLGPVRRLLQRFVLWFLPAAFTPPISLSPLGYFALGGARPP